ncbi:hypothetical protein ACFX13_027670 [Malus domestica]|uniref:Dehydrin 5 n=1 Tax=Malus domestica TaxID=3750 RepID=J9Q177_MALDO|nr:cold-shock protein CS120-like [Malus domestica]XP_050136245.1 cold-shock protein CS120-like [Malus sylvestris]AFG33215.1 dehydrin 5 [Malus domestica]
MAHYQNQHGATPQETDQFGNPIQHGTTGATGFGTATTGYGTTNDTYTGGQQQQKRGMMDKIKDKIPGTGGARRADDHYSSHAHTGIGTTGTGYGTTAAPSTGGEYRERGLMDKIKDKIPGTGGRTDHPTPYGGTTYTGEHQHEGIADKIKDKIPGTGHRDDAYSSHTTSTTAPYGGTTGQHHSTTGQHHSTTAPYGGTTGQHHSTTGQHHSTTAPYGGTTGQHHSTTTPYGGTTGQHHEKKGIMDKIKEKLPGGHH